MLGEVWEPVARWRGELREKHADNVAARFSALLAKSGVSEKENGRIVSEVRSLESDLDAASRRLRRLSTASDLCKLVFWLCIAAVVVALALVFGARHAGNEPPRIPVPAWVGTVLISLLSGSLWRSVFSPKVKAAAEVVRGLQEKVSEWKKRGWEQMEPLNRLFDWSIPGELAHETLPSLEIDPVFSVGRMRDLRETFALDESVFGERSVIGTASGEMAGSPFVLVDALSSRWGERTYTGSRTIHWTERVRGADGKMQTVVRSQTLVAHVTKPVPVHERGKFLLFGNPAGPDLSFSRDPSPLSGRDPAERSTRRDMEREERKLEARARKLDPAHPFTLMANRRFEVLFHAVDRDHPLQFRLLYTPLAQQQTVELLADRDQGWGDDFSLRKRRMVTVVDAAHLAQADVETPPERYRSWSLEECRETFVSFCNDWFKHLYFALAPLMCVPLYQQTRTHEAIYRRKADRSPAGPELESVANACGEERFRHPDSVTNNILKVEVSRREDGKVSATVVAHGFRTEDRVEVVSVHGGDGRSHDVDVPWQEYIPVSRETPMDVLEATDRPRADAPEDVSAAEAWRQALRNWNPAGAALFSHRATVSRFR